MWAAPTRASGDDTDIESDQALRTETNPRDYLEKNGFRVVTGRYPTDTEQRILVDGLDDYLDTYAADSAAADALLSEGKSPLKVEDAQKPALAAYTAVAGVILNLDESITKE